CSLEHEALGAVRIGRREQTCQWATLGQPIDRGLLPADGVHDDVKILHARFHGRGAVDAVRGSGAALVEVGDGGERAPALEEAVTGRPLPAHLDVRDGTWHSDYPVFARAVHLISDGRLAG